MLQEKRSNGFLSFISNFELKEDVELNTELKMFVDKLEKEYQTRTNS